MAYRYLSNDENHFTKSDKNDTINIETKTRNNEYPSLSAVIVEHNMP